MHNGAEKSANKIFCHSCGSKLHLKARFCSECGEPIVASEERADSGFNWIEYGNFIIWGLVAIIAIIIFYFVTSSGNSSVSEFETAQSQINPNDDAFGASLRATMVDRCAGLPSNFSSKQIQSRGGTFNNYGQPINLYLIGGSILSVFDEGNNWKVGPGDQKAFQDLTNWDCIFPFEVSK